MSKSLSLFLILSLAAGSLYAEERAVYVVNMQKVINESIVGKAARNNMEAEIKKEEVRLTKLKADLEKLRADGDKQAALLSADALREKRSALEKKERDLARTFQDKREELVRKNSGEIERIVKQIDAVVKEMAAKNNYEFVIEKDRQFVLYVEDEYDLTDEVVEQLNKRKMDL